MSARPSGEPRIDLMIAGAQKSGTSSLNAYLSAHPELQGTRMSEEGEVLEVTFFLRPERFRGQIPWRTLYDVPDGRRLIGKSAGLMYEAAAVQRLAEHNPTAEVAVIMRDPIKRAYSSFLHSRRSGHEPEPDFLTALKAGPERFPEKDERRFRCAYEQWGRYADYIPGMVQTFSAERVHLYVLEEFMQAPAPTVAGLVARLGVSADGLGDTIPHVNAATGVRAPLAVARLIRSGGPLGRVRHLVPVGVRHQVRRALLAANQKPASDPPLPEDAKDFLRDRYLEPNRELSALMGQDVEQWWGARG